MQKDNQFSKVLKIDAERYAPCATRIIPYARQWIDDDDIRAVVEVLRSDWLTQGPRVREFEQAFASYVGSKFAVAVTSGTAALHLACLAAGIGPGDEVITSPITFVATANCALYVGARPAFVDIDPTTFNLDPKKLQAYLEQCSPFTVDRLRTDNPACHCEARPPTRLPTRGTSGQVGEAGRARAGRGKRTTDNEFYPRAVIPVHFAGLPCDMPEISRVAKKFDLITIEDACHALGAEYPSGERVGSCVYSDVTVFSFHPVKHITTGEGGMITTNEEEIYRRLILLRTHGITRNADKFTVHRSLFTVSQRTTNNGQQSTPAWYYEMQDLGFNYRMTDLQSALGMSQLKKIDMFIRKRREIANYYNQAFKGLEDYITLPPGDNEKHAWHLYVIQLKRGNRDSVFKKLRENGIGVNVHYIPVYLQPYYQRLGYEKGICPHAEEYFARAITLPLYPAMKTSDMERVVEKVCGILREYDG